MSNPLPQDIFVSPVMIKATNEAVSENTLTPTSMGVVNSSQKL